MFAFLSFLGVIALLLIAALFIYISIAGGNSAQPPVVLTRPPDYNNLSYSERSLWDDRISESQRQASKFKSQPEFVTKLYKNWKVFGAAFGLALFLALSNWLFFWASQGHQYYLVYPTGGWSTSYTPGIKLRWFATIQEWQREIDIKVVGEGDSDEGIEGIIKDITPFTMTDKSGKIQEIPVPGIHIVFLDRVNAAVRISIRMTMPHDDAAFRDVAESFRSQENLINNTLIPTVREQLSNIGYQFAAQDYISGAATDFRQATDDQMKSGGYSTQRQEFNDTVYSAIIEGGPRTIKEINTRYKIIRNHDKDGRLIRIPHEITKNKIIVSQVIIDAVEPEPAFKIRLEAQRDISAQKRIEMEKIETAKAEQQRVIAEGEVAKSSERVEQEKEQVKALIAIETQLKQESTKKQLAEIALQTAKLEAEQVLTRERANAESNRLKVNAGLTPQERAANELEKAKVVSENLSKTVWPSIYIDGGGAKSDGGDMMTKLIGADLARQLLNKGPK